MIFFNIAWKTLGLMFLIVKFWSIYLVAKLIKFIQFLETWICAASNNFFNNITAASSGDLEKKNTFRRKAKTTLCSILPQFFKKGTKGGPNLEETGIQFWGKGDPNTLKGPLGDLWTLKESLWGTVQIRGVFFSKWPFIQRVLPRNHPSACLGYLTWKQFIICWWKYFTSVSIILRPKTCGLLASQLNCGSSEECQFSAAELLQ